MTLSIIEIRNLVRNMGEIVRAPYSLLSIPDKPTGTGTPHVETDGDTYAYVVTERGFEFNRKSTKDLDELLYWIFDGIAFSMAVDYELKHRKEGVDSRRTIFERQLEILSSLNPDWVRLTRKEIDETLKETPFDDLMCERTEYCKQLISAGVEGGVAYAKACEKYPLP